MAEQILDKELAIATVRERTSPLSQVVTLIERPDGTHIATVQGKRRDGVIIESVVKVRQEGGAWKVER